MKLGIKGFRPLRPLLRKTHSRCRVSERRGVPFFTGRMLRRPFWLIGFAGAVLLVFFVSSLILFIHIEGTTDPSGKLYRELKHYGVVPGANRGRIIPKMEDVERAIRINHPEFLWVHLRMQGVMLELKVVRRTVPPVRRKPLDLVAAKDGRVTKLIVIQGTPLVQEGDTVAKGDPLLAGYQLIKDLNGGTIMEKVEPKGKVEAAVDYEAVVEEPLLVWRSRPTGRGRTNIWLRFRDRFLPIFSWGKAKGQVFHLLTRKTLKNGRNPSGLVELFIDRITEVRWERRTIQMPQALAAARRSSRAQLLQILSKEVKPVRYWEDWHIEEHCLVYRQTVEVVEEIARPVWEE